MYTDSYSFSLERGTFSLCWEINYFNLECFQAFFIKAFRNHEVVCLSVYLATGTWGDLSIHPYLDLYVYIALYTGGREMVSMNTELAVRERF